MFSKFLFIFFYLWCPEEMKRKLPGSGSSLLREMLLPGGVIEASTETLEGWLKNSPHSPELCQRMVPASSVI